MRHSDVVIAGAGVAGAHLAGVLRDQGFGGQIELISDEATLPYDRPPLSKDCLVNPSASLKPIHTADWYQREQVNLRRGDAILSVDKSKRQISFCSGETCSFGALVFATGARPRRLDADVGRADLYTVLRTAGDATTLSGALTPGARLVIIGGGYIGLEAAAAAAKRGCQVTIVEAGERLLGRSAPPEIAYAVAELHRAHGTEVRLGDQPRHIARGQEVTVQTASGDAIVADHVLVGIGIEPETRLAQEAGLVVDNGIVVDGSYRSSVGGIFAIGDCARRADADRGGPARTESWDAARNQAEIVASAILGTALPELRPTWIWSEQFEVLVQSCGDAGGSTWRTTRGTLDEFITFDLNGNRVCAVTAFDARKDFAMARRLVGRTVDVARLSNSRSDLKSFTRPRDPARLEGVCA